MSDQLTRIENMVANHIEKSNERHIAITSQLSVLTTNEKTNYKKLEDHDDAIDDLTAIKNRGVGILWFLGILWVLLTTLVGFLLF
jgi:hypothetical protein